MDEQRKSLTDDDILTSAPGEARSRLGMADTDADDQDADSDDTDADSDGVDPS
jgi:hypothetical protein